MAMPAAEFMEWQEHFSIYPFSEDRRDFQIAKLCAVIVNMSGKRIKHPVGIEPFLPDFLKPKPALDPDPKQRAGYAGFASKLAAAKSQGRKQ